MLTVAVVDNASALAYRSGFAPLEADLQPLTPTNIFRAAQNCACNAALLPVAALDCAEAYEILGPFGIACHGKVYSVGYFGRRPLSELLQQRLPIYLTGDSQTSRRLFQHLCTHSYGTVPTAATTPKDAEGALLIGDDALRARSRPDIWPYAVDLGEWWHECTRLPFVFAVWVCRRDLAPRTRFELLRWLRSTCDAAESDSGRGAIQAQLQAQGYGASLSRIYARALHYRLTPQDRQAMQTFREMLNGSTTCAATG